VLLKIVIIVAIVIAVVLGFAAAKPKTFRVQRAINIKASPQKIFVLINDFHNWSRWAPQDKEDTTMVRTFAGPELGQGAVSDWSSRGSAGKGRMAITESNPPGRVSVQVDFVKPFEAHNLNEFVLEPAGDSTNVTWRMQGTNLYVMRVMSVFVDMDKVAGKHFEAGLANLKAAAEEN
jgi:uncharacterized protein YndB with AHSA1/START domain